MDTRNVCYGIVGNPDFMEEYKEAKKIKILEITEKLALNENNGVRGKWPDNWNIKYVGEVCIDVITPTQKFTFNELYFRKLMLCLSD